MWEEVLEKLHRLRNHWAKSGDPSGAEKTMKWEKNFKIQFINQTHGKKICKRKYKWEIGGT